MITFGKANKSFSGELNKLFKELIIYEGENYDDNLNKNVIINSYFETKFMDDNTIVFIATDNEKLVGYIYGYLGDSKIVIDKEGFVDSLFVLEQYRNMGIGSKLLELIVNEFKIRGVKYVSISNLFDNDIAKHLYEKKGFCIFKENRRKEI